MDRRTLCGVAVLLAHSLALAAAPPDSPPPPLALRDAVAAALEANPDLSAVRSDLAAAGARPDAERALMPPKGEFQIWQWPVNSLNPGDTGMYMFTVEQELPWRGKRGARVAAAGTAVTRAAARVDVQALSVRAEVTRAYLDLSVARATRQLIEANAGLLRRMADAAEAKYSAGRGAQQDVLKAVLELSRLQDELVMSDEAAGMAQARLNALMRRMPEAPIGALEDVALVPLPASSAELQREAIARHPELAEVDADMTTAAADGAMWRAESKPDLMVKGGYMLMPGGTDALTASIAISWPNAPWSRGRQAGLAKVADAEVLAAKARREAVANTLRQMVHEAFVRATSAERRATLLRTTILPQAEQAFDSSLVAYQADRVDFASLLDNRRVSTQARLDYLRVVADHARAVADLERAAGAPVALLLPAAASTPMPATPGTRRQE